MDGVVILFDQFNLSDNIYETVFATEQQAIVAKLLVDYMKSNDNTISRTEMSVFATRLHEGQITTIIDSGTYKGREVRLSYNKRQFYDRILTPMKSMGLVDYDMYKKTYRLTDKFRQILMKIGIQWTKELERPLGGFTLKK
ncbi:MAG: hypothetical protein ACMXYL_02665 [Candidatus Woesearchaeota archaeon]